MYLFPLTAHLDIPHVMTLHSRFPFDRVGNWKGDADKYYLDWAAKVPMVAISESARDEVVYPLNFVAVIHHGLPMRFFQPSEEQPENFFAWLGRIIPDKGAHFAIAAARKAGVPLVVAGTVDGHLPESVSYYEEMIKPFIDQQQIRYIGQVNMQQKNSLLSRARALLNPIVWEEPFGMVMIEAMAVGCPVISFAQGAACEVVVHRKSGFLVHDVDEMAEYIPKVDTLNRAAVRAYALEHFSVKQMVEKYTHTYKQVIASYLRRTVSVITTYERPSSVTPPLRPVEPSPALYTASQTVMPKAEAEPPS